MSLVFDEYGRPFIILKDQEKRSRKKGASKADRQQNSAVKLLQAAFEHAPRAWVRSCRRSCSGFTFTISKTLAVAASQAQGSCRP